MRTSSSHLRGDCCARACSGRPERVASGRADGHQSSHPHPRESLDRCALKAQLRGDPMRGTAFPASRLLLVEQPGAWGRAGLRESDFAPAIAAAVEARAHEAGVRVIAIRRPGRTRPAAVRHWAYVDTRDGRQVVRWGDYAADADLIDLPLDGSAGRADPAPVYLV